MGSPWQLGLRATPTSRVTLPHSIQVKIPSKEEEVDTPSPTQATYSSSLKRSSPRTISFRVRARGTLGKPASITAWGPWLDIKRILWIERGFGFSWGAKSR